MYNHNDYTYIDTVCPYCESKIILRDNIKEETYCTRCGLILEDNSLPTLSSLQGEKRIV